MTRTVQARKCRLKFTCNDVPALLYSCQVTMFKQDISAVLMVSLFLLCLLFHTYHEALAQDNLKPLLLCHDCKQTITIFQRGGRVNHFGIRRTWKGRAFWNKYFRRQLDIFWNHPFVRQQYPTITVDPSWSFKAFKAFKIVNNKWLSVLGRCLQVFSVLEKNSI